MTLLCRQQPATTLLFSQVTMMGAVIFDVDKSSSEWVSEWRKQIEHASAVHKEITRPGDQLIMEAYIM